MANFMQGRKIIEATRTDTVSTEIIAGDVDVFCLKPNITVNRIIPRRIGKRRRATRLISKGNTKLTNFTSVLLNFDKFEIDSRIPSVESGT